MNAIKTATLVFCMAAAPWSRQAATMPPFGQFRFVNIDIPNSPYIDPGGINNAGIVAGWYEAGDRAHGFAWQKGSAQTLDYPGAAATHLNGINNRGVAIGFYGETSSTDDLAYNHLALHHAVTYSLSSSAWTVLPKIRGYPATVGSGINDSDTAVGDADRYPFGHVSWIWHPDSKSYSYFTAPGAGEAGAHPHGISEDGKIVGLLGLDVARSDHEYGFLKDHDQYQDITVPGAIRTVPSGINKNATVAGWVLTSTNGYFGFVRTSGGVFTMVNYPGSTWTQVSGINDRGVICGHWANPASSWVQGFVAYPR
jgi:hypothetical protein